MVVVILIPRAGGAWWYLEANDRVDGRSVEQRGATKAQAEALKTGGAVIRDCDDCPLLVVIQLL